jgi:deoxyribodipyrimidine photolyase
VLECPAELDGRVGGIAFARGRPSANCPAPALLARLLSHGLLHHPGNARSEFQQRYRGSISWSRFERKFDAWREGRTGYPLVDAAMRQLRREGWMHNRGRLVVGSFLTNHLGIDWRWGERIGRDYPEPIVVDHAEARREAFERYGR